MSRVCSRAASGAVSYVSGRAGCVLALEAYATCVDALTYEWRVGDAAHELRLVRVPGTKGPPYLFGPVENISWNHINEADGFLDRINSGEILAALAAHALLIIGR
jgi:hypothetical protein